MISHTSSFKDAITSYGRELDIRITYYQGLDTLSTDSAILAENGHVITPDQQSGYFFIPETQTISGKSKIPVEYTKSNIIQKLSKNNLGEIFRTYMRSFDIDLPRTFDFSYGDTFQQVYLYLDRFEYYQGEVKHQSGTGPYKIEIGTKVNGNYEYIDCGLYYAYSSEANLDKNTTTYTFVDEMIKTNTPFYTKMLFNDTETAGQKITLEEAIRSLLIRCNIDFVSNISNKFVNAYTNVNIESFWAMANSSMTVRSVLDTLLQLSGCSLYINSNNKADAKRLSSINYSNPVDTITDSQLKDETNKISHDFSNYYNIRGIVVENDGEIVYTKQEENLNLSEHTRYKIKDNMILKNQTNPHIIKSFVDELYDYLDGNVHFYAFDINTTGMMYLEYLDVISINGHNYLVLQNTASIDDGLSEHFNADLPIESQ